jgi:hypothetical protein
VAVALLAVAARTGATLPDLRGGGRLVAYTPRGYDPQTGRAPGPASLRADADELHRRAFRAITTFSATRALMPVCRVFKRRGFRTVLVGVRNPLDRAELRAAEKQRRCADAYVVGDGGLDAGRYTLADLTRAVRRLRGTGRPVAVREAVASYDDPALLTLGDWLFPIANPYRAGETHPAGACGFSAKAFLAFTARAPAGVPVVLAETAFPTAGYQGANENYQRAFLLCIETRRVWFEYFEAFDQPWRSEYPAAVYWGLFRADGTPKMMMSLAAPPVLTRRGRGALVWGRVRHASPEHYCVLVYARSERWQPVAASALTRRGKWKARVPAGRELAVLLVAPGWVPGRDLERLPQVDGAGVFALVGP